MRRVISVSLNGNAFQLEDDAHALLESYLDGASRALAANPDRDEILGDLEQAIADKCARFLGAGRSVLKRADVETVIAEMGPVDGGGAETASDGTASTSTGTDAGANDGASASSGAAGAASGAAGASSTAAGAGPTRRLYQINEGALISGLCNGIAAYFDVDVTIVRVVTVLLAFFTGGAVAVAYFVLMFVVPVANTSEERAAARGEAFNARALIERAREKAAQFTNGTDWRASRAAWRREWRRSRANWRRGVRGMRQDWGASFAGAGTATAATSPPPAAPITARPLGARVFVGLVEGLAAMLLFAATIAWLLALVSLLSTGAIFGWGWPTEHGFWIALAALAIAWIVVTAPLKGLIRLSRTQAGDYRGNAMSSSDTIVWLAVVGVAIWYGYSTVPEIRQFIDLGWWWIQSTLHGTVTV
jgi:phage shock protein PspC (stress-responsive transcriptional regulator)